MKQLKFSILVPVYNVEKYLEQCVDSLLDQTYTDEYEIILVDDGSTDSSGRICDGYAERFPDKVKVIHKKNGGHTSARLEAVKNANGEYCLFCDSDDFVEKTLLEKISDATDKYDAPDLIAYSFNYFRNNRFCKKKETLSDSDRLYQGNGKKELYEALISTPLLNSLCTKAVRTSILKSDPTDYKKIYGKALAEDAFVSVYLITEAEKTVFINEHLYNYRTVSGSITNSFSPESLNKKNTLFLYDRFIEYLPRWGMDTEEYRQKLNARWLNETMYTFSQYYENAMDSKNRKAVLCYDWSSMLPDEVRSGKSNPYENKVYREIYNNLIDKKFYRIKIRFLKKKIRKLIKKLLGGNK